MRSFRFLVFAAVFPVIALMFFTVYKWNIVRAGKKIVFDIEGYDPVNILTGHYLIYQVVYKTPDPCTANYDLTSEYIYCSSPSDSSFIPAGADRTGCTVFIKGECKRGRFTAGIERYNIPEEKAEELDKKVREGKGKIQVSVSGAGEAVVEKLFFEKE